MIIGKLWNQLHFIIWFYFNKSFRFSINDVPGPKRLYSINMWSTPAVWKQYNKMAVLNFFLVNSTLIYILFSIPTNIETLMTTLKLMLKESQIMKKAGFIIDQWSFQIDSMPFTLQTIIFRYNYKSNDVFYSPNSL